MKIKQFENSTFIKSFCLGAILWAFAASGAFACSESLYRVGHGVQYREYTAPVPGNVLVIAKTEAEREFAGWLASTGHRVSVIDKTDALAEQLKTKGFDVILGHFSDRRAIEAQTAYSRSTATFIPVTSAGSSEEADAKKLYERALTSDADGRDYLKAIHKTLKNMSRRNTQI